MSTLRDDLKQNLPLDLDPLVGVHRPSPAPPLAHEEQNNLGEREQDSQVERPSTELPLATEEESSPLSPLSSEEESGEIEECSASLHEELGDEGGWKVALRHSICGNSWREAKEILDRNPNALIAETTDDGSTALHLAAMFGHVRIVEKLLRLPDGPQSILILDRLGNTALVWACWCSGSIEVARLLVEKNNVILVTPNFEDDLPVTLAFRSGHQELGRYLYSRTPLKYFSVHRGSRLLLSCFRALCYDIALNFLQHRKELLLEKLDDEGVTPIHHIAIMNAAILSPSELVFCKRWIYNCINIHSTTAINDVCLDIPQEDRHQGDKAKLDKPGIGLLQKLINITDNFVGVKKLQELKLLHSQADELLRVVCKKAKETSEKDIIVEALCFAAKEGNVNFVFQVLKEFPEILPNPKIIQCFHEALHHRQARVFNLIHGLPFKNAMAMFGIIDPKTKMSKTMMHKAAELPHPHILNRIYAPTLQMQRELQWFKEVESLTPLSFRLRRDENGFTAAESFRKSHKVLMEEGQKWIKETASSCSVVGALIVTIMFAAAFTVPGGNNQNIGYPLFIQQPFFKVFIFSTTLSLLSSSTSVLMFLAILTSKFSEEKLLKSLPTKLIMGLSFLFISIVSMIIAFLSTIRLMLKHSNYSWGLLPFIILASVPVSLFVLSEFPLLLHTCVSTYGNLFDRKVELWP